MSKKFLDTKEAAALLGLEESTLRAYRNSDPPKGPTFYRLGDSPTSVVRYDLDELLAWIQKHRIRVRPTGKDHDASPFGGPDIDL